MHFCLVIHGPTIDSIIFAQSRIERIILIVFLWQILNSESVKRLLNRQNVYLQTPLTDDSVASDLSSPKNSLYEKKGENFVAEKRPALSVIPILSLGEKEKLSRIDADDEHLLPSKTEGKSAIALLPLTREIKLCGHSEECENVMCDVDVERLAMGEQVTPLIAINLDSEDEMDAPVTKHCENEKCDALSIDHDRCRRAVVRCNRCDRSTRCDICLVTLKTRKSKMMHRNCKIRPEYRHNKTSRSQLMKDRMRMRELQILECGKANRIDYSDPINGHDRAIESLQRNSELIVIPKTTLSIQHHPTIRITSVTGSVSGPAAAGATNSSPANAASARGTFGKLLPRYPFFPGQKLIVGKAKSNSAAPKDDNHPDKSSRSIASSPKARQIISIRKTDNNPGDKSESGDYCSSQQVIQTTSGSGGGFASSTPYLMPIRMVPVTGFATTDSSSLLAQRVPKFCLVSQTLQIRSTGDPNEPINILPENNERGPRTGQRGVITSDRASRKSETDFVLKRFKSGLRRGRRKKIASKRAAKSFECTYCSKKFSTDWYFKLHIAKHKGEIKFTCKYCKKPFMHHCNMKKHVMTMHKQQEAINPGAEDEEDEDDGCASAEDDNPQFVDCFNCKLVFNTKIEKKNHRCSIVCLRCHARITDTDLISHLKSKHDMTEAKALEEIDRQKRQKIQREVQNRGKKKRKLVKQRSAPGKTKEMAKNKFAERENGNSKRKRGASNSNDQRAATKQEGNKNQMKKPVRRLTRRRNRKFVDRSETPGTDQDNEQTRQQDDSTVQSSAYPFYHSTDDFLFLLPNY